MLKYQLSFFLLDIYIFHSGSIFWQKMVQLVSQNWEFTVSIPYKNVPLEIDFYALF